MTVTYGSLFSGAGMLDEGVQSVLGGELSWYAEVDSAASKVMAHHYPGIPNLGDVTRVDWASVPHVDVLTGGSPCQDLSHAGKRAGMTAGTRSNLWVQMREAIAVLRPRLVVWENVRGALSASADSDLEPCPGCVGGPDDGPVLRALGRVLGDLAELGYDARWYGLRAADVGAAHGRFRIFLFATPADAKHDGWASPALRRGAGPGQGKRGVLEPQGSPTDPRSGLTLLPTPVADNSRGLPSSGTDFQSLPNAVCALLSTPAVNDMGEGKTVEQWDEWTDRMKAKHGNGNGHGASLAIEAQRLLPTPKTTDAHHSSPADLKRHDPGLRAVSGLLPTPRATDGTKGGPNQRGSSGDLMLPSAVQYLLPTPTTQPETGNGHARNLGAEARRWGQYAPAIARWEAVLGRPAPEPTETTTKGTQRLSPRFVEWMMGLPEGWVTGRGLSRPEQLKCLGNGVVPQQAAAATAAWVADTRSERAA